MWPMDELHIRKSWKRGEALELLVAREAIVGGRFLGFGRGRSWSTSVGLVSSGEAWICTYLIS